MYLFAGGSYRETATGRVMDIDDLNALQDPAILDAIASHAQMSPQAFMMKYGKKKSWPVIAMAEQLGCRKRLKSKLPDWQERAVILDAEALQQSSSTWTAQHKAQFMGGTTGTMVIADLCGGLGIDLLAAAQLHSAQQQQGCLGEDQCEVHYNDISQLRCDIFRWNAQVFGQKVQIHNMDAAAFLASFADNYFDVILCDPSRRHHDKRVVSVHACEPNIIELADLCRAKSRQLILKLSPSITEASLAEAFPGMYRFVYMSLDGERKESVAVVDLQSQGQDQDQNKECRIEAHCLYRNAASRELQYERVSERIASSAEAQTFVYDPDPAVIAAGVLPQLCRDHDLKILSSNHPQLERAHSVLLTHSEIIDDFPGQIYQLQAQMPLSRKPVRRYLREHAIERLQIMRCNCGLESGAIRRILHMKDGGSDIGLCARTWSDDVIFYHLRHLS